MVHIEATQETKAAPETVWALLADAAGWQRWSPMDESSLERNGAAEPNGVGAIRRFRTGRIVSREEVLVFDGPRHLAYGLVSGLPLRDYRADVTLTRTEQGTSIAWRSQFVAKVPGTGWIYAFLLRRFLVKVMSALAAAAEEKEEKEAQAASPSRKAA